ncbi:MAG: hypothetical protein WDN69_35645 [Aliidongia sp.]
MAVGAGMLGPVLLLGLIDWISWGRPFQSVELNLLVNYSADAASQFGADPWYQYALWESGYWSFATLLIVPLAIFGARRLPLLLIIAITIYAAHAMIPHKEPRFVFPALPLLLTLVGVGTSDLLSRWGRPVSAATIGAVFWISVSALLGSFGFFAAYWTVGAGMITAMRAVNAHPASCGFAIAPGNLWWRTGGYTRLRPGLSIYGLDPGDADASSQSTAYSDIAATGDDPQAPQPDFTSLGFHKEGCWENGRNRAPSACGAAPGRVIRTRRPRWSRISPIIFRALSIRFDAKQGKARTTPRAPRSAANAPGLCAGPRSTGPACPAPRPVG